MGRQRRETQLVSSKPSFLYNYVVSAQKPTSVTHTTSGRFTSPYARNLIIGKCTIIEIYIVSDDGLQGVTEFPVHGRITSLQLIRLNNSSQDVLFVSTERYKYFVVGYDEDSGDLFTLVSGDVRGLSGRPSDSGQIGIFDPSSRMLGLYIYEGMLKVIPLHGSVILEPYDIRVEELDVIDLTFLYASEWPTLALLHQDPKGVRHLRTYEIRNSELIVGSIIRTHLDAGARMLISVPHQIGGVIVISDISIIYVGINKFKAIPINRSYIRAACCIDCNGLKFLLSDDSGLLSILILHLTCDWLVSLSVEPLGHSNPATSMVYLDNGLVFVGASSCDSQLVKLHSNLVSSNPPSYLEILETFINLGPILDFCYVDMDGRGQGKVVTCSGVSSNGTLRIVRNGIGINEQASYVIPGVKGIWSLYRNIGEYCQFDYLIITFVRETREMFMTEEGILKETKHLDLQLYDRTIFCGNVVDNQIVQVTQASISLLDSNTGMCVHRLHQSGFAMIDIATSTQFYLVYSTQAKEIVCLKIETNQFVNVGETKLLADVSTMDLFVHESSTLLAVGCWSTDIVIYSLPSFDALSTWSLNGLEYPRSLKFAEFDSICYLLCALSDGSLIISCYDLASNSYSPPRQLTVGLKPMILHAFKSEGVEYVLSASDLSSVIYSSSNKVYHTNINEIQVNFIASISNSALTNSVAFATSEGILVGTFDIVQKLHIQTIPLYEQPRRISYQYSTRTFGILTQKMIAGYQFPDSNQRSFVKLMDENTFEVCDSFELDHYETGCSINVSEFSGDPLSYFVVGTAYDFPGESEPVKGRILVFRAKNRILDLITEYEVSGAVYNVNSFYGGILAGINSRIQLFDLVRKNLQMEIQPQCSHTGHILALHVDTADDKVIVGDLMKSMTLLEYNPSEKMFQECARDYNSTWVTCVKVLDENTFLAAENGYNLFLVRKNILAVTEDERLRLEVVGGMHIGELVNRFRSGSLVRKHPDVEHIPTVLFGTVNGVIGVIASLPEDLFVKVHKLQNSLRSITKGIGCISHSEWRSFENDRTSLSNLDEQRHFIDGDLVENFLGMSQILMEKVAADIGDMSVYEIRRMVEDLSRLH